MIEVRGSEIYSFLNCRKRWDYEFNQEIEAVIPNDKLFFGTIMHKFLEVFYRTRDYNTAYATASDLFIDTDTSGMDENEYNDIRELLGNMVVAYENYWGEVDGYRETLATEIKFRVPLMDGVMYTGTIDHVFSEGMIDGRLWLEDHKTASSVEKYAKSVEFDRQITRYLWAFDQLSAGKGEIFVEGNWVKTALPKPTGMIFNILGKSLPEPPRVLKNGTLSKDKNQRTTYTLYMQELHNMNLAIVDQEGRHSYPTEYADILNHLQNQETDDGNPYFRRVRVYRNDAEKQAMVKEMMHVIWDMRNARGEQTFYRNFSQGCAYCPFKTLCVAEQDGSDATYIRDNLYRPKDGTNKHNIEEVV